MIPIDKNAVMAYDRAITVFSPEGRLYQVEYAAKIIERGTPAMAVKYKDGIMFLVDFNFDSKLLITDSIEKVFKVDNHIYFISAGLAGDARKLSEFGRDYAAENKFLYDEPIEVCTVAKRIATIKQYFTQYGGMRPFGVSFIVVGLDESGYHIFETEPSGAVAEYAALAIGRGKHKATALFEKKYSANMSAENAVELLKDGLKEIYEKAQVDFSNVKIFDFKNNALQEFSERKKAK